ncbi:type III-B CRISPR module RAMP protein Cmr6 [Thioalkalivibrio sp. ALE11]|uniref:type III-B CRISPR module RAMP protein Cmr6 n=1 Tax=Thioalkalivibrio sp. ALE11 TaxID=1265494 RepID=UPI000373CCED|nr:type III-B CRISPR module RAMP protein Cmr6 [Thioalkalivibrio sp. ALE11]
MPIAAVPKYIGQDFTEASPGMRFGMYLNLWGIDQRTQEHLWETHDTAYEITGKDRRERSKSVENKAPALEAARTLNRHDQQRMVALETRAHALAAALPDDSHLLVEGQASAPFTTGLGIEHPLENGFAFLDPYGLPVLPGSGIKGVLRQAARELAGGTWGDDSGGWDDSTRYPCTMGNETVYLSMIDALFGLEIDDGAQMHVRGALTFWDVVPQIAGNRLHVEIMTPHQAHYYQQRQDTKTGGSVTPHDSGQPTPIPFLTVPPGSRFSFHVVCDKYRLTQLTPELAQGNRWQQLLAKAFEHAFDWLGFGAKTAVGYGAMTIDRERQEQRRREEHERREAAEREAIERRRQEEEAEAARRRQQEFEALPESEQALRELAAALEGFAGLEPPLDKSRHGELAGLLNKLDRKARGWTEAERHKAADAIEAAYDRFGWTPSGLKKDKREKQENKRRDQIAALRNGSGIS